MHSLPKRVESRREFFRAAGRGCLLGLLAVVAGRAGRAHTAAGGGCRNRGICGGCASFASCGLPAALSARAIERGG